LVSDQRRNVSRRAAYRSAAGLLSSHSQ
jgi:hypothetical protein